MKKNAGSRRKRKITSTALIQLDTRKLFAEKMKVYKRRRKVLEQLEQQTSVFKENDDPEYQKFLALKLGAEQTRLRDLLSKTALCQSRINKIRDIAYSKDISPGQYCWLLWQKVTPEHDFWYCLEEDISEWLREEDLRREKERMERQERREKRKDKPEDEWDLQDFADDFKDLWFGEDDEDEDMDFGSVFDEFDKMFGDSSEDGFCERNDSQQELKKLYRELCLKYHPDRTGICDEHTKKIWNDIQDAYAAGDIDRLRSIRSDAELAEGKQDLSYSELDNLILDMEIHIKSLRHELRDQKKNPWFGFAGWDEKQRSSTEKKLRNLLNTQIAREEATLLHWKERLERVLHGWQPRNTAKHPKKHKNATDIRKEFRDRTGDLFDF